MPLFEIQYPGQADKQAGLPTSILQRIGPLLNVTVGVTPEHEQKLRSLGIPVPEPVPGVALIDTGASITVIDESIAQQLKLRPTAIARLNHPGGVTNRPCYPVQMLFPATALPPREFATAVSAKVKTPKYPHIVLLGRDFLRQIRLVYNGPKGRIEMAF